MSFFTAIGICACFAAVMALLYGKESEPRPVGALLYLSALFNISGLDWPIAILTALAAVWAAASAAKQFTPSA